MMRAFRLGLVMMLVAMGTANAEPRIDADVVYGHKEGMALVYDVISPAKANGAGIIYMVSGGWFSIWQDPAQRAVYFSSILDAGFTVFAVHHGSAPRFKVPEAVSDVRAAVRHIKMHASEYGVDSNRLGVWGGSAGGHLSLMLGLNPEGKSMVARGEGFRQVGPKYLVGNDADARVAAVVAYYPPVDIRWRAGPSDRFPALDFDKDEAGLISPILFVTSDDPPVKLIHGDADGLVPVKDSLDLEAELKKVGVTHDLLVIEGGDHGFRNPEHRAAATEATIAWFTEHLLE